MMFTLRGIKYNVNRFFYANHGDCQFLSRMSSDHARLIAPPLVYENHAFAYNFILTGRSIYDRSSRFEVDSSLMEMIMSDMSG